MKKTLLLIIGLVLLALLVITSSIFISKKNRQKPSSFIPIPSPVRIQTEQNIPLQIITTNPTDKQVAVPISQIITITFNKPVSAKDISFTIEPNTSYLTTITKNQLFISFSPPLLQSTTYTIKFNNLPIRNTYTFTTANANAIKTNDNASESLTIWSRAYKPDLYIYNQLPHDTSDYSITGSMTQIKPYHFYFNVSLLGTNKDQSKQAFVSWLQSLGLTDTQIQGLDIRYL